MSTKNREPSHPPKRIENLTDTLSQRSFFKYVLGQNLGMSLTGRVDRARSLKPNVGTAPPEPKLPTGDDIALTAQRIDALLANVELDKMLGVAKAAGQQAVLREVVVEQPPRQLLAA